MARWCLVALLFAFSHACTDILVTPGASTDGSSMIAYNADSPTLFGSLYHYPASKGRAGEKHAVYDWDSGVYHGEIEQVNVTYNVVGNANEHGLVIGETTFGGTTPLAWNQSGAVIDYGSLIYLTLQRAKTVDEAIFTMVQLMDTYGYASGGESFSLTDESGQVWMMEVIGRGSGYGKLGAVWVAMRIPDGAVAAHANQARITTFPRDDPQNCLYAEDVVDVAVFYGLYPADADPLQFSFSDVYNPLSFISARQGEARVWSIFSAIADESGDFAAQYENYALGVDTTHRMPLYITPYRKLALEDVMSLMNSHYEDTKMDSSLDVGAGLFAAPYRPRPLVWEYNGTSYHNERNIATAKTGWNFIAVVRPWMPAELAVVVWFGCDDSSTAPRVPYYSSSRAVSPHYAGKGSQDGVLTPILSFDMEHAFWVQNMVSNFAYYRWMDVYPVLRTKIANVTKSFLEQLPIVDQRALEAYNDKGPEAAVKFVTLFSVNAGNAMYRDWLTFYGELFARFRDFYNIVPKENEPVCSCEAQEPGMSDIVKQRIVSETGSHYRLAGQTLGQEQTQQTSPF